MPKRILIVDDSPEILKLLYDLLTEEGYFVITRSLALHELGEVRLADPNLIILDHLLKALDSSEDILVQLSDSIDLRDIPVLICTPLPNAKEELVEQLKPVNVELIVKPFEIDELLATVKRMIEQAEARADSIIAPYAVIVLNIRADGSVVWSERQ
jgi:DNA-binding response OmpR family regulator